MPVLEHKDVRTWEELIEDIDILLSGDVCEVEAVKELLQSFVAPLCPFTA